MRANVGTIIRNIAQLVVVPVGPVRGDGGVLSGSGVSRSDYGSGLRPARPDEETQNALNGSGTRSAVSIIADAVVILDDDRITWFGPAGGAPRGPFDETIDAGGGIVVPGLIDCHTHALFAGHRAGEFVERIRGRSYLEIMQAGGGIRSTMRAVRAASEDDLVRASLPRLQRMLVAGVTTVEIKSGYGLSVADEIKMLRAIRRLAAHTPQEIVPTYLAAHAVPPEFEGRADDYIDAVSTDAVLDAIAREGLAEFADAFCEKGAFTTDQCRRFLQRCASSGLRPKLHADQITDTGATRLAVELNAASADHLERIDDAAIDALKASFESPLPLGGEGWVRGASRTTSEVGPSPQPSPLKGEGAGTPRRFGTIPVLLPGCSFFLNTEAAPARRLIDAGLPVALATDCNPGSCMIESLPLVMSIACCSLRMTPMEALVACTANAAVALGRADRLGAVAVGHQADLLVLGLGDIAEWPYRVGVNPVRAIIKAGKVIGNCELRIANCE